MYAQKHEPQKMSKQVVPKVRAGPEPLLLSRKEIDVLYDVFDVLRKALALLQVEYIVTGGSLLGAVRQHSILFCDDDIDIAVLDDCDCECNSTVPAHDNDDDEEEEEESGSVYESVVVPHLQSALDAVVADKTNGNDKDNDKKCIYQIKPWEGGDRIRSKRYNSVFVDLFVLRKYPTLKSFLSVIGVKRNGQAQPESYVNSILDKIKNSTATATTTRTRTRTTAMATTNDDDDSSEQNDANSSNNGADAARSSSTDCDDDDDSLFPFWQFSTRNAIEMWPKEVYRANKAARPPGLQSQSRDQQTDELFPLQKHMKIGPLTGFCGPNMPVTLLKRAFGDDCFEVYYRIVSHHHQQQKKNKPKTNKVPRKRKRTGTTTMPQPMIMPPTTAKLMLIQIIFHLWLHREVPGKIVQRYHSKGNIIYPCNHWLGRSGDQIRIAKKVSLSF